MNSRQTRFSDVCGSIDELKRLLHEQDEKEASNRRDGMDSLLKDALFMLERMKGRLGEYKEFRKQIGQALSSLNQTEEVKTQKAEEAIASLHNCIQSKEVFEKTGLGKMDEAAESIRTVAGAQEDRLRRHKDLALKIEEYFQEICGDRPWLIKEADVPSFHERVRRKYQAWLPPKPHADMLLEFLQDSRAYVLDKEEAGQEPLIQFEDGGSITMSQVRYDAKIRNFHPASFRPASLE